MSIEEKHSVADTLARQSSAAAVLLSQLRALHRQAAWVSDADQAQMNVAVAAQGLVVRICQALEQRVRLRVAAQRDYGRRS